LHDFPTELENTMKTHPRPGSLPLKSLTLALALPLLCGAASAGPGTQTEDDIYVGKKRQVEGVTTPASTSPSPKSGAGTSPNTARSAAPSATAVPPKNQVQGVNTPGTTTPQLRPGAGASPNTAALAARKNARAGGDDDLDELEVERRKVQGVNMPGTGAPLLRPGAGTSPNTGRSTEPAPSLLPGK
jgi:hypothetical protein